MNGEPSWLPDPTGRHQHRWFDGHAFTDRVADDGATSIDPGPLAAEAPPAPVAPAAAPTTGGWAPPTPVGPAWGPAWPAAQPAAPQPPPAPAHRSRLPLVLALLGTLLVLGGGLAVLLTRDDDAGAGTFEGTVDDGSPLGTHEISLRAGDVLLVTLRPGDELDAVLGVLVDGDGADALDDTYDDLPILDRQDAGEGLGVDVDGDRDQLLLRTDIGFSGEGEELLLAVADDVDVTVVVAPFDPGVDEDGYEITLEVVDLDVDEGADGEELLEAVEDDDRVPSSFQGIAEELLGG